MVNLCNVWDNKENIFSVDSINYILNVENKLPHTRSEKLIIEILIALKSHIYCAYCYRYLMNDENVYIDRNQELNIFRNSKK